MFGACQHFDLGLQTLIDSMKSPSTVPRSSPAWITEDLNSDEDIREQIVREKIGNRKLRRLKQA